MAKRKTGRKKSRRRVGAASSLLNPKSPVVKIAATAVGYLLADRINSAITNMLPITTTPATATTPATMTPSALAKYVPYIELGAGAFLLLTGKPSLIKTALGGVLAGAGLKATLKVTGIISGYQSTPVIGARRMAGYQSTPVIGAPNLPSQLSGTPAQLEGFRVNGYLPTGSGVGVLGSLYTNADGGAGSGLTHEGLNYMD